MEPTHSGNEENVVELSDAEILDELTTSRGELKQDRLLASMKINVPRFTQMVYRRKIGTLLLKDKGMSLLVLVFIEQVWEIVAQFLNLMLDTLFILFAF